MMDYGFYVNEYKGSAVSESGWPEVCARAKEYLAQLKRTCRVTGDENAENMAVCAIAEAMDYFSSAQNGLGGMQYASVGTVAVSGKGIYSQVDITPRPRRQNYTAAQSGIWTSTGGLVKRLPLKGKPLDCRKEGSGVMLKRKSGEAGWRSLCDSTVTVYRRDGLTRQVLEKVYFDDSLSESVAAGVGSAGHGFLLVVPGAFDISPGDKVIRGLGPALEGWEKLNSADVPGLGIVKTVAARYLVDRVSHVEVRG